MRAGRRFKQAFFWILLAAVGWFVQDRIESPVTALFDSFFSGTRLDPFWDAAKQNWIAVFVGLGFWCAFLLMAGDLIHQRLLELLDVDVDRRIGSKQFFLTIQETAPEDPTRINVKLLPHYYVLQPWFVNHSTNENAEAVSARVDAYGESRILRDCYCQWALSDRDAPMESGHTKTATETSISAGGNIPAKLNVALRYKGETTAYLWTNENKNARSDMRHPRFALERGFWLFRVRLRGKHVKKTVWLAMKNPRASEDPAIYPATGWWRIGMAALLWRKRRQAKRLP